MVATWHRGKLAHCAQRYCSRPRTETDFFQADIYIYTYIQVRAKKERSRMEEPRLFHIA